MRLRILGLLCLLSFAATSLFTSCDDDSSNIPSAAGSGKGNTQNANKNDASANNELARLEFPKVKGDDNNLVVIHRVDNWGITYALEWDCKKKSQRWSCFQMHSGYPDNNVGRTVNTQASGYPQDPDIPAAYRFKDDPYYGSGYDHGHICASEDRQYSKAANTQTFYQSNMQPQFNIFNAGIWLKMEQQLQKRWNNSNFRNVLYVVKGGTIDDENQILGYTKDGLLIPKHFFMALLCEKDGKYKALAFWVEHLKEDHSEDALSDYVVNIDRLEILTGIDFFCNLPDDIEKEVESATRAKIISDWNL